ncbi:MAG: hypothetical protein K8T20_20990, partial [Planctomycetes bacterium]|nr:hypothetical protein [Planctomycetota bacterium]
GSRGVVDLDAALAVFANLVNACAPDTRTWWRCKIGALRVLALRGRQGDFETAQMGLADLKSNHPNLDGGKFGIEEKVKALEKRLAEKGAKAR